MSSDPPLTRSPLAILDHHQPPLLPLATATATATATAAATLLSREYRKGNWTVQETLVLITAKRLDDDRRSRGSGSGGGGGATTSSDYPSLAPRSAEQRWKWVENYCWKQGCHRSQNQCNDKWDNLLRDYKKVRDYESRAATSSASAYWSLERHERKDRNLPTNLAFEVYEALTDVLSRRATLRSGGGAASAAVAAVAVVNQPRPLSLPQPPPPPLPSQASVSGTVVNKIPNN